MVKNVSVKIAILNYATLAATLAIVYGGLLGAEGHWRFLLYPVVAYTFLTIFSAPVGMVLAAVEKQKEGYEEGAKRGMIANGIYLALYVPAIILIWPKLMGE
ncbi:hypothetical protein [Hydrogenimonas sp.]